MQYIKQLVSEYLYDIKGSIKIYDCWHDDQFICEIFILRNSQFMVETHSEFAYNSYDSFYTKLPNKIVIDDKVFDFFLNKYHGFTASFYIMDEKKVKYLYPSSFMNNTEQLVWISESLDEIKSFIDFVRNLTIIP